MGRVWLEQGQCGAERYRLRNELAGADSRLIGALRDLPYGAPCAFTRREQGHRGAVELRGAYELEAEFEGGKPETEGLTTTCRGALGCREKGAACAMAVCPAGVRGGSGQPILGCGAVQSPPSTALGGGNTLNNRLRPGHGYSGHPLQGFERRRSPAPKHPHTPPRHNRVGTGDRTRIKAEMNTEDIPKRRGVQPDLRACEFTENWPFLHRIAYTMTHSC